MTEIEVSKHWIDTSASKPITPPKVAWPELAISPRYIKRNGWEHRSAPEELSRLPEDIQVHEKLRQILTWSLLHGSDWAFEPPKRPAVTHNGGPTPAKHKEQNDAVVRKGSTGKEPQRLNADNAMPLSNQTTSVQSSPSIRGQASDGERSLKSKLLSKIRLRRLEDRLPVVSGKEATTMAECTSCFDELQEAEMTRLKSCQHLYCKDCLSMLITTAISSEASFPPKCCLSPIPLKQVLRALDIKQREEYQEKVAEYAVPTSDRWYCPNTECLKWIPNSRLRINKDLGYNCPHCSTKLCRTCRGNSHPKNTECPQDFGLEATLEIAEIEGWQRCYKCRALVEHNKGCRHMTCRCGGQFCYVCGARWQTCNCTETDAANKRAGAQRRRDEKAAKADAEAAEFARAIAEVEELERREAEERRAEEQRLQREEEEQLLNLEAERQAEELARQIEAEQAEHDLRKVLVTSFEEEWHALEEAYRKLSGFQSVQLTLRHRTEDERLIAAKEEDEENAKAGFDKFNQTLTQNSSKRRKMLKERHSTDLVALEARQEEEEDDLFIQVERRLRGKSNKESRTERMFSEIQKQHREERSDLIRKQQTEIEKLDCMIKADIEGVQRWHEDQLNDANFRQATALQKFGYVVGADRKYFEIVGERRIEMLNQHYSKCISSIERGEEPVGLTEFEASKIQPALPMLDDGQPGSSGISRGPTVVMTPHSPLTLNSVCYESSSSQASNDERQSPARGADKTGNPPTSQHKIPPPTKTQLSLPIPGAFPIASDLEDDKFILLGPTTRPSTTSSPAAIPATPVYCSNIKPTRLTIPTSPILMTPSRASSASSTRTQTLYAPSPRTGGVEHTPTTPLENPSSHSPNQSTTTAATLAASVALALGPQPISQLSTTSRPQPQQQPELHSTQQHSVSKSPIVSTTTVDQDSKLDERMISDVPSLSAGGIRRNRWKFRRSKEISEEEIRRRLRCSAGDGWG